MLPYLRSPAVTVSEIKQPYCRCLTIFIFLLLGVGRLSSQSATEVYLADLTDRDAGLVVSNLVNISDNPGYDNQPSFLDENNLLYSRTRDGQTDIARYSLGEGTTTWLSETPGGSEYSPLKIPGKAAVSAIRLDTNGLQRLYRYPAKGGKPVLLVDKLKIGYHLWYDEDLLVCTVLVEDRMDLVLVNIRDNTRYTVRKNVGRSLQRIPGSGRFSYTERDNGRLLLKSMDPHSREVEPIVTLPEGVQDICWISGNEFVCGRQSTLLRFRTGGDASWKELESFTDGGYQISRLAYEPVTGKLAIVMGN
jgi:hypothetical protein